MSWLCGVLQHVIFLEPVDRLVPRGLGGILAITRAIVGMEAVRGARIDVKRGGFARGLEPALHLPDLVDRNASISLAVETEHRDLGLWREIERALRNRR